ncbi:MAG: DUF3592 domain-containing protein [Luteolibacter sp.]|uniref:DUF3592 domain-containing protein n=1 Tax=Luteolibacter sp. TaxID=1962973 RepID=UPI0032635D5E
MTASDVWPLAWLFSLAGPLLLVASVCFYRRTRHWLRRATRHLAVVADRGTAGHNSATPPTVQWTDAAGMIRDRKLNVASSRRRGWLTPPESGFETGQQLWIYDSPDHPTEAILASTWGVWGATILCLLLGLSFTAGGCFLLAATKAGG